MRLVRLKPHGPGPDCSVQRKLQSRTTLDPEISRENMSDERQNALSLMAIESNLVRSLNFESLINRTSSSKARKAKL